MFAKSKDKIILICVLLLIATVSLVFILREARLDRAQSEILELLEAEKGNYDEGTIVLSNTSKYQAQMLAQKLGAGLRITSNGNFATLSLPEGVSLKEVFSSRENREYISDFSLDFYYEACEVEEYLPSLPSYSVSDPGYPYQNYIDELNIGKAWDSYRGSGVTVAVIDTGIDTDHPEFSGKISEYSYNATEDKIVKDYKGKNGGYDWSLVEDAKGHGTAVAGIIAASMNNGIGVAGIAPEVNLLVIKCNITEDGKFIGSDIAYGIYYAIERDADVVNMSLGGNSLTEYIDNAIKLAFDSDVICVAAAGNDATPSLSYPAAHEKVIGVGALAENSFELAPYSNYGDNVNIVAPGTTYTTQMGGGYSTVNGTSMAAPIVSGAIALYIQQNKYVEFPEIREMLYASSRDTGILGPDYYHGYGALDISALIAEERGKITFDYMTGEIEDTEQVFIVNHTLQNLPEPERNYCVFDGWYYDMECTDPLEYYEDVFSADLTLYASWVNEDDGLPFTYRTLVDGTIEITGYKGHRKYITIPDLIDGKPVTSIAERAFEGEKTLRRVNLPKNLVYIKKDAFKDCSNLIGMTVPSSVVSIGSDAFSNNVRMSEVVFEKNSKLIAIGKKAFSYTGLREFNVPASVENIDGSAFYGTSSLERITVEYGSKYFYSEDGILFNKSKTELVAYPCGKNEKSYTVPDTVTKIGNFAFAYSNITEISLSNTREIGESALEYSLLRRLTIPDSVRSIGNSAFYGSYNLEELKIGKGLSNISASAFSECNIKELAVPENVVTIGEGAFYCNPCLSSLTFEGNSACLAIGNKAFKATALVSVKIPTNVTTIGKEAFSGLFNLSEVSFEENSKLTMIDSRAFSITPSLMHIELPDSLRTIGDSAFSFSGLSDDVTIPRNVSAIGAGAFGECLRLTSFTVSDDNASYQSIGGVIYTRDGKTLVSYPAGSRRQAYTTHETTETIGAGAFYGSKIISRITLNDGVRVIGTSAFERCENVYNYTLPATLESIEELAFSGNSSIEVISIPDNVIQIARYSFKGTAKLRIISFTENSKLSRISFGAFSGAGIREFLVPKSVTTMAQGAFTDCENLYRITFAKGSKVESLSAYSFTGCDSLQTVVFEEGSAIKHIQAHAFDGVRTLKTVNFKDAKLEEIDNFAFKDCKALTDVEIPDGVTYIGRYAFYNCKALSELVIPESIDFIGRGAFMNTNDINLYFLGESLPTYTQENWDTHVGEYYLGVVSVSTVGDWKYAELSSGGIGIIEYFGSETELDLTKLDFGGSITQIGNTFEGKPITSIVLPDTLRSIQKYAFARTMLKSVTIPDSVEFIGQHAFYKTPIRELRFGENSNLGKIEKYAFARTASLTEVTIPASVAVMERGVFSESGLVRLDLSKVTFTELPDYAFEKTAIRSVVIPDSITKIGNGAFVDCISLTSVSFGKGENLAVYSNAFYNTGISELYIPKNLTYIGECAFVGLQALREFKIAKDNPNYTVTDGLLYNKSQSKLIACPAGKTGSITLPESLQVLGFGCFENSKLERITFNKNSNILTFGYRAFYNADGITEITIPKSVVSIDYYAFAMSDNLTSVVFEEGTRLTGIYEGAFYGCRSLENISIPDSVVEILDFAFYGCDKITEIPVSDASGVIIIGDYAFAYSGLAELSLSDEIFDIGEYAFMATDLTSVTIPTDNENLAIGLGAFYQCNIEKLEIPFIGSGYTTDEHAWIGYIFGAGTAEANEAYMPKSLKKVTVTGNISFISKDAFNGASSLEEIDLPDSIIVIYPGAFKNCSAKYELMNAITFADCNETLSDTYGYIGTGLSGKLKIADSGITGISRAFMDCTNLTTVEIPDSVTFLDYAFMNCTSLTSIDIPDSVTSIAGAFYGCTALTSVEIPETVTDINSAFSGCTGITSINVPAGVTDMRRAFEGCTSLRSVNIPNGVTSLIGTFIRCTSLTSVVIPDGVTNLTQAFDGCTSLKSVNIPKGIMKIDDYAFFGCESLSSVTIPKSVTEIGAYAFSKCESLTSVTIPEGVLSIGTAAFYMCSLLNSVVLPESLTTIGQSAFYYCEGIFSITIPRAVTSIEREAFYGCSQLYEVINKSDLNLTIGTGDNGFVADNARVVVDKNGNKTYSEDYYGFEYIDTPDGFRFVAEGDGEYRYFELIAYFGNNETVTLPTKLYYGGEEHDYNLAEYCGLKNVVIPSGMTEIKDYMFSLCKSLTSVTIPEGVTSIGSRAFQSCTGLTDITIPKSVTKIGEGAFAGCKKLTEITIPEGVKKIDGSTFADCTSLTGVTIPKSVTEIGGSAFSGCKKLTEITLPDSLTSLDSSAFNNSGISKINLRNNPNFTFKDGVLYDKDITAICFISSSVTELVIPKTVTSFNLSGNESITKVTFEAGTALEKIGDNTFSGCTSLTSVVIPEGVTYIGSYAFSNCTSLGEITISESVTGIGYNAFLDCEALGRVNISDIEAWCKISFSSSMHGAKAYSNPLYYAGELYLAGNLVTELVIPSRILSIRNYTFAGCTSIRSIVFHDGVRSIGDYAFSGCTNITSITIPSSVTSIEDGAFSNCTSLTSVNIPDGVTSLSSVFEGCTSLTSIVIPNGVTNLYSTFSGCTGLTEIIIPDGVTNLSYAFNGCTSLTSIKIPDGVTDLSYVFNGCTSLTSIIIPNGVTSLNSAFYGCTSLKSVTIPDGVTNLNYAFNGCTSLTSIIIPEGVTKLYGTFEGCTALTSIVIPEGVASIEWGTFSGCTALAEITLPKSLTKINSAFSSCIGLKKVNISDIESWCGMSITYVNDNPLYYAGNLYLNGELVTHLVIPEGVTSISARAFYGCTSISSVTLPSSLTSIGSSAFYGCEALGKIINNSDLSLTLGSTNHGRVAYYAMELTDKNGNVSYRNNSYIDTDDGFRFLLSGNSCYLVAYFGNEETVTLPLTLHYNGKEYRCILGDHGSSIGGGLRNVIVPEGITDIGTAFRGCRTLTGITIPSSVKRIEDRAFYGCTALKSVEIGDGVIYVGNEAFENTALYNNPDNWRDGNLYIGRCLVKVNEDTEYYVAPEDVTVIADDAFKGCYKLKLLEVDGLCNLSHLTNLETLIIRGSKNFYNGSRLYPPETLKTVVLRKGFSLENEKMLSDFENVTIYVDDDEEDLKWDEVYPGWSRENVVIYGENWVEVSFFDEDGSLISREICQTSKILRQPYIEDYVVGEYTHIFEGWDLDGDGRVDTLPATSHTDITARAMFTPHKLSDWTLIRELSCTESGLWHRTCLECGEAVFVRRQTATGHTEGEYVKTVLAGCVTLGYDEYTCTVCGENYHTNYTDSHGHTMGDWITDSEPTCTILGSKHRECLVCKEVENEPIAQISHNYTGSQTKEPTCTVEGIMTYVCLDCGDIYEEPVPVIPHNHEKVAVDEKLLLLLLEKLPSISVEYDSGDAYVYKCVDCGHLSVEDSDDVGSSIKPADTHVLGDYGVIKAACCIAPALYGRSCVTCGEVLEIHLVGDKDASAHAYETNVTKPASCKEDGQKAFTCTDCGDFKTEAISKTDDHSYGNFVAADGDYHERTCTVCGDTEKLAHSWNEGEITKEPSYDEEGVKTFTCLECGATKTEAIAKVERGDEESPNGVVTVIALTGALAVGVGVTVGVILTAKKKSKKTKS